MVDGEEPGVDSRDEGKHTGRNDLLFVEKMMVRRNVLEFYTPCKFSATANARDFEFCTRVGHAKS